MNNCGRATINELNQQIIIIRRIRLGVLHARNGQQTASYLNKKLFLYNIFRY
jgi:hypothetical protein